MKETSKKIKLFENSTLDSFRLERNFNYLINADCLDVLLKLPDESIDLIYIDPPFCTQRKRNTQKDKTRSYQDNWPLGIKEYLEFIIPRLTEMKRILKPTGSIFVHLDYRTVHYIRIEMDKIFGAKNFMNEIIWSYRSGGNSKRWFARKHQNILAYAKRLGEHKFKAIREGNYNTDGLNYDEKGIPYKTTRSGRLYFDPHGPILTDVWQIPFISTVGRERTGYPDQKPLEILNRIIRATTEKGDIIADFFCGSGTTAVAAEKLGRSWLAVDINPQAIKTTLERLDALHNEAKP